MALSYAFALATITQQINKVQESVNGAFMPLISTVACEIPQRLDAEESFRRCTAIAHNAHAIKIMAEEGMGHLEAFRSSDMVFDQAALDLLPMLDGLSRACRTAKKHILEMFAEAERSTMWQGELSMLNSLKKKYVKALSAVENISAQLAIEVRQHQPGDGEISGTDISRAESLELIKASHIMLGAESPKWMSDDKSKHH